MRDATAVENLTLVLDFLEWLARGPRSYDEVMESWRTSCPRFPIWEDSLDRGFVARERRNDATHVALTGEGRTFLASQRG